MQDHQLRVATICTGNICRSPMAEVVLKHLIAEDPRLRGRVEVSSAGTARWHVGSAMDPRARGALDRAGYQLEGSLGAYASAEYLDSQDVIAVMTREHLHDVKARLSNSDAEVLLWRSLIDPLHDLDVADPYYGNDDDFDECLAILSSGSRRLTSVFHSRLDEYSREP